VWGEVLDLLAAISPTSVYHLVNYVKVITAGICFAVIMESYYSTVIIKHTVTVNLNDIS